MFLPYSYSNHGIRVSLTSKLKKYCSCQRQIGKNQTMCSFCRKKQKISSTDEKMAGTA